MNAFENCYNPDSASCTEIYNCCKQILDKITSLMSKLSDEICCAQEYPKASKTLQERVTEAARAFCEYLFDLDIDYDKIRRMADEEELKRFAEDSSDCPSELIYKAFLPCYKMYTEGREEKVDVCGILKAFVRALVIGFALCKYARRAVTGHAVPELLNFNGDEDSDIIDLVLQYKNCLADLSENCKTSGIISEYGTPSVFDVALLVIMYYASEAGCGEDVIAEYFNAYRDILDYRTRKIREKRTF